MSTVPIICPHCRSTAIRRKGMTSSGTQRYACNECRKSFTFTPVGRPCLGDRPLTNYESVKRHRLKQIDSELLLCQYHQLISSDTPQTGS